MDLKLKICGMKHAANIAEVADLHPDYLGFIFYKQSPRSISEITAELIKYIPPTIRTTGVFVNEEVEVVRAMIAKYNLKAVQLHGQESVSYLEALKETNVTIIKAFGIDTNFDFDQLKAYQMKVDYFLFDTQTPAHGGSGKVFDWTLLQNYQLNAPYFLSGGIGLKNVDAIRAMDDSRLYGIDVNSRFEIEPGLKKIDELKEFKALMGF